MILSQILGSSSHIRLALDWSFYLSQNFQIMSVQWLNQQLLLHYKYPEIFFYSNDVSTSFPQNQFRQSTGVVNLKSQLSPLAFKARTLGVNFASHTIKADGPLHCSTSIYTYFVFLGPLCCWEYNLESYFWMVEDFVWGNKLRSSFVWLSCCWFFFYVVHNYELCLIFKILFCVSWGSLAVISFCFVVKGLS